MAANKMSGELKEKIYNLDDGQSIIIFSDDDNTIDVHRVSGEKYYVRLYQHKVLKRAYTCKLQSQINVAINKCSVLLSGLTSKDSKICCGNIMGLRDAVYDFISNLDMGEREFTHASEHVDDIVEDFERLLGRKYAKTFTHSDFIE